MSDKKIIIDGTDVSGCKHYKHNDKNSGWSSCTSKDEEHIHAVNPLCCENKDCLYKQLAHKTQECEELKKELETVYDDCKGCPTCNEAIYNANLYSKECRKLKQTLTDIKEICNSVENIENINSLYDAKLSGMFLQANKIIQKISECEVENE